MSTGALFGLLTDALSDQCRVFISGQEPMAREEETMPQPPMYNVEIADATGHTVAQMTQEELSQKAEVSKGTWVFVNDQMVNAADLRDMKLDMDSRIRLMPGLVGGQDAPRFVVHIADASGHTEALMTRAEVAEKVEAAQGTWVFVNDRMVNAADLADMPLDSDSRIRLMPGLIGGSHEPTFVVQIADATGHSEVVMTQAELTQRAEVAKGTWVFVNDQLVSTGELAGMALNADSHVRMVPGLVGGGLHF